jgi:hypothetical protein
MSAGKVIENVIIFGGIGAMAYLLLKKPMPVKVNCEYDLKYMDSLLNKIKLIQKNNKTSLANAEIKKLSDEYNSVYQRYNGAECKKVIYTPAGGSADDRLLGLDKICAEKKPTPYTDVNLYAECLQNSMKKSEIYKPLIDPSVINDNPILYNTYDATYRSLYLPSGEIRANSCGALDGLIKGLNESIANNYKLASRGLDAYKAKAELQEKAKNDAIAKFDKFKCRDKIEAERTKDLIALQSKGSIKAEESIVTKGFAEQKTYIIIGALVLLTGFYVVVKK